MKISLKNPAKISAIVLLLCIGYSCSKSKSGSSDPAVITKPSFTAKIDTGNYTLDAAAINSTYYTTDGDDVKALMATGRLNTAGNKIVFFINDFKAGSINLSKKTGTSLNPGNPHVKVNATTATPAVQTYVQYVKDGNSYYAASGTITVFIKNSGTSTVSWNINFIDASGRSFTSIGTFDLTNYQANPKPKSQIVDPTPVGAKPTIESISPQYGWAGDSLTITGVNYSPVATENEVFFSGLKTGAVVKSASTTKLVVVVPSGNTGNIFLRVRGRDTTTGPTFNYYAYGKTLTLSPSNGNVGDIVTITGPVFSTTLWENVIKFNGKTIPALTASYSQITFRIPDGAISGDVMVSIKGSDYILSNSSFYIYPKWEEIQAPAVMQNINLSVSMHNIVLFAGSFASNYLYSGGYAFNNNYNNLPFDKTKNFKINSLATDSSFFYITTSKGIAKSPDGISWTKLTPDPTKPDRGFTGMVVFKNNITLLSGSDLLKSTDAGNTWTKTIVTGAGTLDYITTDIHNDKYYYAVDTAANNYKTTGAKTLYVSPDKGLSWSQAHGKTGIYYYDKGYPDFLKLSGYAIFCSFSATNNVVDIEYQRLYVSTDQGESWTKLNAYTYAIKSFGNYLMFGKGNLSLSTDMGKTIHSYVTPQDFTIGAIERTDSYTYILGFNSMTGAHKIYRTANKTIY